MVGTDGYQQVTRRFNSTRLLVERNSDANIDLSFDSVETKVTDAR